LKCFDVAESVLDVRIDNQFDHSEDFTAKVKSIAEPTLFSFIRRQRLLWIQIEVVVKVQEV
jgi:hypothetical protein